ncbi:glycosyltransferase family 9 protein [Geobacter anodireducens]|uniref:glycosyltransferase family 9 protein n=1 Tax=Geobacter anodireducens TaxID=1340425 RepID=UPI001CF1CA4B|nr:glycosyltransferase family 9 protein [Geobacter anodireducens]
MLKLIDSVVGRTAAAIIPPPSFALQPHLPKSILVIRPGGIGDAALLAPALHALQRSYPGVSIDILAERRNAGAFALCPGLRSVSRYDVPAEFFSVLRSRYDVVIDTEQWHRLSAVVARIVRAGIKIGFATNERRRLFTHPIPYEQDDYEADSFMCLLTPLGISGAGEGGGPFLAVPARDTESVEQLLGGLKGRRFVALFPGASIAERRWGAERFASLAALLVQRGIDVVVVGGESERADGRAVEAAGGLSLCGRTGLAATAAVIGRSALLVSGDSGILHIAVGLGIPTVSLFGPGRAKKWAPRNGYHSVINKGLPCSPCTTFGYTPKCPENARCMADITVDEVKGAVLAVLEKIISHPK